MKENDLLQYEPPVVVTYTDEQILEELGPARTSGSSNNILPVIHPTTN